MKNHIGESSTTSKIFRFSSGQFLTLNECQIEKIPYLTALVSAETNFDSVKADDGYYLLDSHINYKNFLYVLDSISFQSVRQLFTSLPKNYNILAIIALLDFLAIESERDPTLEEVNSSFFWTAEFGNKLGTYQFVYRPCDIQDMSVRFAIALTKDKYDFKNRKVIDQIYWFIMFILSAHELFETHLRYHVYIIAQNCFATLCPSLLKYLHRLEQRTEKEIRETSITINNHKSPSSKNSLLWNLNVFNNECTFHFWDFDYLCIKRRLCLTFRNCFCNGLALFTKSKKDSSFFCDCRKKSYNMDNNLEPSRQKILQNMYKHLLSSVLEQVSVEAHGRKFNDYDELIYKPILDNILNSDVVQVTIHNSIVSEIWELKSKLERQYAELMKEIQIYERNHLIPNEDKIKIHSLLSSWDMIESLLEKKQNEALACEKTLNKLHQYKSVIDEIESTILVDLHDLFIDEIQIFINRQEELWTLINNLSCNQEEKIKTLKSTKTHKINSTRKYRRLPKIQCKYKTH
ncbi:unnamed protein product [Rotaria sp. Silwood2]|nr:unnamed protein product [Rotaria sp. Silwood2]CAF4370098.1 unnamed protein product [Rotaria sp. Silwood2]